MWDGWRSWLRRWRRPKPLGRRGEAAAARYLKRRGYRILARGERTPLGELDLVAEWRGAVVFVEVKTRRGRQSPPPAEAVDDRKQQRLTRAALAYLKRHRLLDRPARFDVVAVRWADGRRRPEIEHIRDAFPAAGRWQMF